MYISTYLYVYIYISIYICTYIHIYMHTAPAGGRLSGHTLALQPGTLPGHKVCVCVSVHHCVRACAYLSMHACMCTCMHTCINMYARLHACITCMCARLDLARNNLIMHACMHACIILYTRAGEAARQRRQHAAAQLLERLPSELDSIEPQSREDWLDACREALLRSCRPLPPLLRRALAGCDAGRALQGASV